MQASDIPTKFPIPWANSAGSGYARAIPEASQIGVLNGAASLTDGFPPLTFLATASGGVPPFGQDTNGILKQITQWLRWAEAGAPVAWDSSFSSSIGGYADGAIVASATTPQLWWLSTADNNTTNPDSGGAGWSPLMLGMASRYASLSATTTLTNASAGVYYNVANGVVITLPAPSASTGLPFGFYATGACSIVTPSGQILGGALSAGTVVVPAAGWLFVQSDGSNYRVISASPSLTLPNNPAFGASNATIGTSVAATTVTFTAPSNGNLFVISSYASKTVQNIATATTTASLPGMTQLTQVFNGTGDGNTYNLPMRAGQSTSLTISMTASASDTIAVGVSAVFMPGG